MQKRLFQRLLIITMLVLTLTGCASIKTRVSSCQQMWANTLSANHQIPRQEHQALLAFDKATHGGIAPAVQGTFPCKSILPPCQWSGVTCVSGHVTRIVFIDDSLSGEIPPELGNLSHLQALILPDNYLTGEIPAELGNLGQLKILYLYSNQLVGPIPVELANLSQLQWLSLAGNQLSGEIPPELGSLSQLLELELNANQLSGEIPPELGNLSQLYKLLLSDNPLSGPLPHEVTALSLYRLHMSDTSLCVPQTDEFEAWIAHISIMDHDFDDVPYCE